MQSNEQKLREALSELIEAYNRAGPELSRAERAVDRMRLIAAHEALALPTATPDQDDLIRSADRHLSLFEGQEAFSRADMLNAFYQGSKHQTVTPVGERAKFDAWKKTMQDGFNEWDAWQARAALSDGDAVDAQRYRWLKGRSQVCLNQVWIGGYTTRHRDGDFLSKEDALSAIDAAIDAAMRKGQL